jgi:hypothetical protein
MIGMKIDFSNINRGIYFIFYDNERDVGLFLDNFENRIFVNLNLNNPNSVIAKTYFRKKRLRFSSNLLKSYSYAPQETFSVVVDLIKKNKEILMGTVGLSYDSIAAIYFELRLILGDDEKLVFICHQRKIKTGDYEIFGGDLLNEDDIINLFLKS